MDNKVIKWDKGHCSVHSQSGMIGPVTFNLSNGKECSPFHIAPWTEKEINHERGIMNKLRGEWICVPFGIEYQDVIKFADWNITEVPESLLSEQKEPHGYSSNAKWEFLDIEEKNSVSLKVDYPKESCVDTIKKTVWGKETSLFFNYEIKSKKDCTIPIGAHPTFSLPCETGCFEIKCPAFKLGITAPYKVEKTSLLEPNMQFKDISKVPGINGKFYNCAVLPWDNNSEELVQICGVKKGEVILINKQEGYKVTLMWDKNIFPSVLLWISNKGRDYKPWSSQNVCLGVEPIVDAFGMGMKYSLGKNPINEKGIPTAIKLKKDKALHFTYSVTVESIVNN